MPLCVLLELGTGESSLCKSLTYLWVPLKPGGKFPISSSTRLRKGFAEQKPGIEYRHHCLGLPAIPPLPKLRAGEPCGSLLALGTGGNSEDRGVKCSSLRAPLEIPTGPGRSVLLPAVSLQCSVPTKLNGMPTGKGKQCYKSQIYFHRSGNEV